MISIKKGFIIKKYQAPQKCIQLYTQQLLVVHFVQITASMYHGMKVTSLWHCCIIGSGYSHLLNILWQVGWPIKQSTTMVIKPFAN